MNNTITGTCNSLTIGNSAPRYIKLDGRLYQQVETVPSKDVDVACNAMIVEKKTLFQSNQNIGGFWGGSVASPAYINTNNCCFNPSSCTETNTLLCNDSTKEEHEECKKTVGECGCTCALYIMD